MFSNNSLYLRKNAPIIQFHRDHRGCIQGSISPSHKMVVKFKALYTKLELEYSSRNPSRNEFFAKIKIGF